MKGSRAEFAKRMSSEAISRNCGDGTGRVGNVQLEIGQPKISVNRLFVSINKYSEFTEESGNMKLIMKFQKNKCVVTKLANKQKSMSLDTYVSLLLRHGLRIIIFIYIR